MLALHFWAGSRLVESFMLGKPRAVVRDTSAIAAVGVLVDKYRIAFLVCVYNGYD